MSVVLSTPLRCFAEGEYADEAEGVDDLCAFAERSGAFEVYREVEGVMEITPARKQRKDVRIDVLLFPKQALLDRGWDEGVIGVECKRPGKKLGDTVAQAMDYAGAGFLLRSNGRKGGLLAVVRPLGFYIFPYEIKPTPDQQFGDLESVMASNRVGTLKIKSAPDTSRWLHFKLGGCVPLKVYENGDITVTKQGMLGRKVGSR